jgi:hypothetical protein
LGTDGPKEAGNVSAKHAGPWGRIRRWAKSIAAIIAAVGVISAGVGYITSGVEFFSSISDYFRDQSEVRSLITAADERLARADFEAAWLTNAKARQLAPRNTTAAEQQARVAMTWLRSMYVAIPVSAQRVNETVDPLKSALIERLGDTRGREKANLYAHIGWANFLRYRAGRPQADIVEEFDAAIREDADNPYAHAMRGFWILSSGGPIDRARGDLDAALRSGVDPAHTDLLVTKGLLSNTSDAFMLGAIEYADRIRKAGRNIDDSTKKQLLWYYSISLRDRDLLAGINTTVPVAEQSSFLDWLRQANVEASDKRVATYFMAFFAERGGKTEDALRLYRELITTSRGAGENLTELSQAGVRRLQR